MKLSEMRAKLAEDARLDREYRIAEATKERGRVVDKLVAWGIHGDDGWVLDWAPEDAVVTVGHPELKGRVAVGCARHGSALRVRPVVNQFVECSDVNSGEELVQFMLRHEPTEGTATKPIEPRNCCPIMSAGEQWQNCVRAECAWFDEKYGRCSCILSVPDIVG